MSAPARTDTASATPFATAVTAVGRGELPAGQVFWFTGGMDKALDEAASAGALAIRVACDRDFPLAFEPVKDLLRALAPLIEREAPFLLKEFGPELLALLPEYGDRGYLRETLPLNLIALGGTIRRLHKDSELLFRLVFAVASLVVEATEHCPSLAGRPLVLAFSNLDAADRQTLSTVLHVARRIAGAPVLLALTAADRREGHTRRFWRWQDGYDEGLSSEAARLTDAYTEHAALVERVLSALAPIHIDGEGVTETDENAGVRPLPASGPPPGPRTEATLTPRAFAAVRADEVAEGLAAALGSVQAGLALSMNFENMLFCCRELLRHSESGDDAEAQSLAVAAWQLTGITQTYLEHHDAALDALNRAFERAARPEARAQTCYYAGLIAAKRKRGLEAGAGWFERGLAQITAVESAEAALERGWLCNGLAFIAWQQGRFAEARALVDRTLAAMAAYDDPQALNLRINLLNNLSLVHEETGNLPGALSTWQELAEWARALDGGTLAKAYYYREGWLHYLSGDLGAAAASCLRAVTLAEAARDFFHMDLISATCGYLACRQQRYEEALYWYEYNRMAREKLGDRARVPSSWAALGHAALQAGERERATESFRAGSDAAVRAGATEQAALLRGAAAAVAADGVPARLTADDEFAGVRLEPPRAKLTAPFALAHLATDSEWFPRRHHSPASVGSV